MKKISKVAALLCLAVGLSLGLHSIKAEAISGDGFYGVPKNTYIEAGNGFSSTSGIKLIENGRQKAFSVYLYKSRTGYRKVSSSHYINTKINGSYMLRYESASGKYKAWRRVTVKDTKPPMFSGVKDVSISYGSKFSTTKGIIAHDIASGRRGYSVYYNNKKVSKKNYINTKKVGYHKLRYEVSDKNGLKTVAYRNVKVLPRVAKTSRKKTTVKKTGRVYHIYPRLNDERGFWYWKNDNRLFIHSWMGENLTYNKGDIVKVTVSGKTYQYIITDKFVCFGDKSMYPGVPRGKEWVAPSRNKYMKNDIDNSDLVFQTCQDGGYSKIKILTASAVNGSAKWNKK